MRTKILALTILSALLALGYALSLGAPVAQAGDAKNLRILPSDISQDDLKSQMKGMARALGVQCDHCHDMDDMAKDTETKKKARGMMQMTRAINRRHLRNADTKVTCMTCHRGEKTPNQ